MKHIIIILLISITPKISCQILSDIEVFNRGMLCIDFNGAAFDNTPVKNLPTKVNKWLYLKSVDQLNADNIVITFFERVFKPTNFEIIINNNIDTILINKRRWIINLNESFKSLTITPIENVGPTIDSILFLKNQQPIQINFNHKSVIDNEEVILFQNKIKSKLLKTKSKEIELVKNYFENFLKKNLTDDEILQIKPLLNDYYEDPMNELCDLTKEIANSSKDLARHYLFGNQYSSWSRSKRITKSKKAFAKAAKLYQIASLLKNYEDKDVLYRSIYCLIESEDFIKAEKLLDIIITKKDYDPEFFRYYFMAKNKASTIRKLRLEEMFYEKCGESADVIDSEYHYLSITFTNALKLHNEKKYDLLLEFLNQSCLRINWSKDQRLNNLNKILCQLLINALSVKYSIIEIQKEFEKSNVKDLNYYDNHSCNGIFNAKKSTNLYGVNLIIYEEKSSIGSEIDPMVDDSQLITFDRDSEKIKEKTFVIQRINELLSITRH